MPLIYLEGRSTIAEIGEIILREIGAQPYFMKKGVRLEPGSRLREHLPDERGFLPTFRREIFDLVLAYSLRRTLADIDQDFQERFGIQIEFFQGVRRMHLETKIGKLLPSDHWAKIPHGRAIRNLNEKLFEIQEKILAQVRDWSRMQQEILARFPWFEDSEYFVEIYLAVGNDDWHYGDDQEIIVARHDLPIRVLSDEVDYFFRPQVPDESRLYSAAGDPPERHAWLLYDLYDQKHIPREDLARIRFFSVDFIAWHQRYGMIF